MSKIPVLNTIVPAGDFPVVEAQHVQFSETETVEEAVSRIDRGDVITVTYAELVSLRDNRKLSVGEMYRITDYTLKLPSTTSLGPVASANHPFDIVVTAISKDKLSENASAVPHEGDTYFKNSKLEAWEIKYILDNDKSRADWAVEGGRGVIIYMKDEYNNECTYDFKNVLFRRYKVTGVTDEKLNLLVGKYVHFWTTDENMTMDSTDYIDCYTFTHLKNGIVTDLSVSQEFICRDNKNCLAGTNTKYLQLPNNVWTDAFAVSGITPVWEGCRQVEIQRGYQNTMGYMTFISAQYGFDYNIISYCRHMDFGNTTRLNKISNDCTEEHVFGFNESAPQGICRLHWGNERLTGAHFGENTQGISECSHTEGNQTSAAGKSSHAEGQHTVANGVVSHAGGDRAEANGRASFAHGSYVTADSFNQAVFGMYNKKDTQPTEDKTRGEYAFIIGNGTDETHRSNALAVKWDGTLVLGSVSITPAQLQALLNKL